MSIIYTPQEYGAPFVIGAAVVEAMRSWARPLDAKVLDNPKRASDIAEGDRLVFFEDQGDKPRGDQPGQSPRRVFSFAVGVIRRTVNARLDAHRDYQALQLAVRGCMPFVKQAGIEIEARGLVHGDVLYRLENIDVGGGLVLGMFTLDYREPKAPLMGSI